jgi:hypothetical protein
LLPAAGNHCNELRTLKARSVICTVALWVYPLAAHRSFFVCARKLAQNTHPTPPAAQGSLGDLSGGGNFICTVVLSAVLLYAVRARPPARVRPRVPSSGICELVVYQAPDLQVPYHYANMVRLW